MRIKQWISYPSLKFKISKLTSCYDINKVNHQVNTKISMRITKISQSLQIDGGGVGMKYWSHWFTDWVFQSSRTWPCTQLLRWTDSVWRWTDILVDWTWSLYSLVWRIDESTVVTHFEFYLNRWEEAQKHCQLQ